VIGVVQSGTGFIAVCQGSIYPRSWKPGDPSQPYLHVLKIDSVGNKVWDRVCFAYEAFATVESEGGGCIILAMKPARNPFTESSKAYVLKIDGEGNEAWEKYCGEIYAREMVAAGDGGCVVAGEWCGVLYIVKIDGNGETVWEKVFEDVHERDDTLLRLYGCEALAQSPDGGFLVAGRSDRSVGEAGGQACYLLKVDRNGKRIWEDTKRQDELDTIVQSGDGGFIVRGVGPRPVEPDHGEGKTFRSGIIAKLDARGREIWREYCNHTWSTTILRCADGTFVAGIVMPGGGSYIVKFRDKPSLPGKRRSVWKPLFPLFASSLATSVILVLAVKWRKWANSCHRKGD